MYSKFLLFVFFLIYKNDDNEELMLATPDGQIFSINCTGDILCFDLGEPIRAFHIGLYSSELFTSSISLVEPGIDIIPSLHSMFLYILSTFQCYII